MAFSWMFCVVVLLWYSTQLQIVLAEKTELVSKQLDDWVKDTASQPDDKVDEWSYSVGNKRLSTEVQPGGASWFITPSLNLPNTSYLDIEASCSNNPCQLEIYGTNESSARPLNNFEFIQNVTFETRSVNTTTIKKSYPHLYILARTSKTSWTTTKFYIYSIKIRYYFCEKTTIYNTDLSQVYSSTTDISILVQCRNNAIASDGKSTNITVMCTPEGNWTFGDLKCFCDKGFHSSSQGCSHCLLDHYKSTAGDERCQKCLDGKTNNTMHTQCECKEDHYVGDDEDGPCYAVPLAVQELTIQTVTSTSVKITWSKPKDDGGFDGSLRYSVECYHSVNECKCDTIVENATFFPAKTNLNTTYVVVSNLNGKYKFKVISMNSLKNVPSGKWKFKEILAVVRKTIANNDEAKCEEKASNPIAMFFVGVGVTLAIVLFVLIVIQIYKRRRLQAPKVSTNVLAVGTVHMQAQSSAEPGAEQSQNNQGLDYVYPIGGGTAPYEEASPPAVYAELNRNQQDGTTADNTYQKLLKHDSNYALPVHAEAEPSYEEVGKRKPPPDYQELDSTKRVLDDSASYQRLTNFQRSASV